MQVASTRYLTPPQVAERFGVDPAKVVGWIRKGELGAVNVGNGSSRPRYRISPADLALFEAARAVQPPSPRMRRRRADPNVIEFF
ncbi:MAG: helix-turn-helix domain-containing protein [Thermoguttaceae bacterium]